MRDEARINQGLQAQEQERHGLASFGSKRRVPQVANLANEIMHHKHKPA